MRQLEEAVLEVLFEANRNGECPGVAEISRRAGIFSGKGDRGEDEPGSMTRSIAWGVVLKLFRAWLIRKCPKSPGRSGYEPAVSSVRSQESRRGAWLVLARGESGRMLLPAPDNRTPDGTRATRHTLVM